MPIPYHLIAKALSGDEDKQPTAAQPTQTVYYLSSLLKSFGEEEGFKKAKQLRDSGSTVIVDAESIIKRGGDRAGEYLEKYRQAGYKLRVNYATLQNLYKDNPDEAYRRAHEKGYDVYNVPNAKDLNKKPIQTEVPGLFLDPKTGQPISQPFPQQAMRGLSPFEQKEIAKQPLPKPMAPEEQNKFYAQRRGMVESEIAPGQYVKPRPTPETTLGRFAENATGAIMAPYAARQNLILNAQQIPGAFLKAEKAKSAGLRNLPFILKGEKKILEPEVTKPLIEAGETANKLFMQMGVGTVIRWGIATAASLAAAEAMFGQAAVSGSTGAAGEPTADIPGQAIAYLREIPAQGLLALGASREDADQLTAQAVPLLMMGAEKAYKKSADYTKKKFGEYITKVNKAKDAKAVSAALASFDPETKQWLSAEWQKLQTTAQARNLAPQDIQSWASGRLADEVRNIEETERQAAQSTKDLQKWRDVQRVENEQLAAEVSPQKRAAELGDVERRIYQTNAEQSAQVFNEQLPPLPQPGPAEQSAQAFMQAFNDARTPQEQNAVIESARTFMEKMPPGPAEQSMRVFVETADAARLGAQSEGVPRAGQTVLGQRIMEQRYQTPQDIIKDVLAGRLTQEEGAQLIGELRAGRPAMRPTPRTPAAPLPTIPQEVRNAEGLRENAGRLQERGVVGQGGEGQGGENLERQAQVPPGNAQEGQVTRITPDQESALRSQGQLAETWYRQYEKDTGGRGIAVGAGDINYLWKYEGMSEVIRRLRNGEDPDTVAAEVKAKKQTDIANHNSRRPKDINWQRNVHSADSAIDGVVREFKLAGEKSQPQPQPSPAPEAQVKHPWEMTRDSEFATLYSTLIYNGDPTKVGLPLITKADVNAWIEKSVEGKKVRADDAVNIFWSDPKEAYAWHRMIVKEALAEGKPVPPEVLAEYPDLAKPVTHQMPTGERMTGTEHPGAVPGSTTVSETMRSKADALDAEGSANIRKALNTAGAGINYDVMVGVAQKTAALMLRTGAAGVDFAQWSRDMVNEYGPEIQPKLEEIWRMANRYHAIVLQQQQQTAPPAARVAPPAATAPTATATATPSAPIQELRPVGDLTPPVSPQNTVSLFNAKPPLKTRAMAALTGEGGLLPGESKGHRIYQNIGEKFSNAFNRILYSTEKMEVASGKLGKLKPEENPWMLMLNLMGFNNKFGDAIGNGLPGARGQGRIAGPITDLFEIIKPLGEGPEYQRAFDMAEDYAVARSTIEDVNKAMAEAQATPDLKDRIRAVAEVQKKDAANEFSGIGKRKAGMSDSAAAADFIRNMPPEMRPTAERFANEIKTKADAAWKYALAKGLITPEYYDAVTKSRNFYVPFKRWYHEVYEPAYQQAHGSNAPGIEQEINYHRAGSSRPIESPTLGVTLMWNKIMHEADRNEMVRSFYDLAKATQSVNGEWGGFMREVPKGTPGAITVWVNGVGHDVLFEPMVHNQLKGLNKSDLDFGHIGTVGKFVRNMITYTPPFALMNWTRAVMEYPLLSEHLKVPLMNPSVIGRTAEYAFGGGKETASEAARYGLGAQWYMKDRASYIQELTDRSREIVQSGGRQGYLLWPHKVKEGYEHLIGASELGPRLAEYRAAKKYAKEKLGYDDHNASIYASTHGADLPNFAIMGTWMKPINSVVPFSNAAVQSFKRFFKAPRQNTGKFLTTLALGFILPRYIEYQYAAADPERLKEWQGLPSYWRDMFLNFKIGNEEGDYIRIPLGFEAATLSSVFSRSMDAANGNPDAFRDYDSSLWQQFMPFDPSKYLLNSWLAAPFELAGNKEFFTGRYIVSPREEGKTLKLRTGTKYASSLSKYVSDSLYPAVEVDPRNIDFTIKKLFGRVGTMATSASSVVTGEKPPRSALGAWVGVLAPHNIYADARVQAAQKKFREYGESGSAAWKDISQRLADIQELPPGKQRNEMAQSLYQTLEIELNRFKEIEKTRQSREEYLSRKSK